MRPITTILFFAITTCCINAQASPLYAEVVFFVMEKSKFDAISQSKKLLSLEEIKNNAEISFFCVDTKTTNDNTKEVEFTCKGEHENNLYKVNVSASYTVGLVFPGQTNWLSAEMYSKSSNQKILSFSYKNGQVYENKSLNNEYVVYYGVTDKPVVPANKRQPNTG